MAQYNFWKAIKQISIGIVGIGLGCGGAIAQNSDIIIDGRTNTLVEPFDTRNDIISGGFISESSLLHSFQEFNIGEGKGAFFYTKPTNIENIFSLVTGSNVSNILGTLGTFGNSTPSLWLANPNGILFGPNAQLNVQGSFVGTTASAINIDGNYLFSTPRMPDNQNILNVDSSVLIFNALSAANIENQSQVNLGTADIAVNGLREFRGLAVPNGESLILASPSILVNGGGLNALGGTIQLFSSGSVDFTNAATAQAESIFISTNQLSVTDGSQILSRFVDPRIFSNVTIRDAEKRQTFEVREIQDLQILPTLKGGNLSIFARGSVEVTGTDTSGRDSSRIGAGAIGLLSDGGNVSIQTDRISVQEGGQIASDYISLSDRNEEGGEIDIAAEVIEVIGRSSAEKRNQSGFFVGNGYRFRLPTNGAVNLRG